MLLENSPQIWAIIMNSGYLPRNYNRFLIELPECQYDLI